MPEPALIGVDWGTTSFRAFLLDQDAAVLDRRSGPHGILTVMDGDFARVLRAQIRGWLTADRLPIVMSGMIGSRQGWLEAPYAACPASLDDLAGAMAAPVSGQLDIRIVPGCRHAAGGMTDVMRGEETQVFGALDALGVASGLFLLPGTHSKWVRVQDRRIVGFATYMTGEIYAACAGHTILGRLMPDGAAGALRPEAFRRGVREGARPGGPGALLNRLFGVRTLGLFGTLQAAELPDYLSGLLIGAELADAGAGGGEPVRIIASAALAERYRFAAAEQGLEAGLVDPDCVARGHAALWRRSGLTSASLKGATHA